MPRKDVVMGLLTIENGRLTIQPEMLAIPVFEKIWDRDKEEYHPTAIKELSYIYYMYDYNSPFRQYQLEDNLRHDKVLEALEIEKLVIDSSLQQAIDMYKEIHRTYSMLLLEDAEVGVHKLRAYFRDVDLLAVDDKDKPIYKANELVSNLKNLGGVVRGIKELKDEVEKEQAEKVRIRGGSIVDTSYEKPRK